MALNLTAEQKTGATTLMQDISHQVTCSICLEHFKVPKTLPCLHNFCRDCLQETIQSSAHPKMPDPVNYPGNGNVVFSFPCPACRADIDFPVAVPQPLNMREIAEKAATNEFKTNFHVESQLDMFKKKMEQGCMEHQGETLLFFCKTCNKAICQLCLALEHIPPEHTITSVHRVAKEKRDGFKSKKERVVKRKTELDKAFQGCQRKLKDMQKVKNQCKKASQELDALYAVMADFRKEMNTVDHSLTQRVSRMINDNHTICNRIERCQKQSKELDKILRRTDQELLQQSSEETTSLHENLPQIPHVSPNSVSTQLEDELQRICKSIAEVKSQLRGFCRQHASSSASDAANSQQKPGPAVSQQQQQQQQQPSIPAFQPQRWPPAFPVPSNPFAPPHSSGNIWTSSTWQPVHSVRGVLPPPPGLGLMQPPIQRPRLAQQHSKGTATFSPIVAPPGTSHLAAPPGTSHLAGPSTTEKPSHLGTFVEKNVLLSTVNNDDDDDDEEEDEEYDYQNEGTLAYRDVWSDDNSDY